VRCSVRHAAVLRESRRPSPFPGRTASPFPFFSNPRPKAGSDWKSGFDLTRYEAGRAKNQPIGGSAGALGKARPGNRRGLWRLQRAVRECRQLRRWRDRCGGAAMRSSAYIHAVSIPDVWCRKARLFGFFN